MSQLINIAVDAMGGDGSPKDHRCTIYNHKSNKDIFYKIFGDKKEISNLIEKIDNKFFEIHHTDNKVESTDSPLEAAKR